MTDLFMGVEMTFSGFRILLSSCAELPVEQLCRKRRIIGPG